MHNYNIKLILFYLIKAILKINLTSSSFHEINLRDISPLIKYFTVIFHCNTFNFYFLTLTGMSVEEIASFSKTTISIFKICSTFLCFVFLIGRVIFFQLVRAMGKLTFVLIWAKSKFHKFSA